MIKEVQLHFPLAVSDSSYYQNLIQYPPEGYKYISQTKSGLIGNTAKRGVFRLLKTGVRNLSSSFRLSRPLYAKSNKLSPEFVHHFAHCIPTLSKSNGIDYILDVEGAWQLAIGKLSPSAKKKIVEILSKDNCKAIMPWTKYAYNEFVKEFPELEDKTTVLRPAVPLMQLKQKVCDPESFTMLYVARDFKLKNGPLACRMMDAYVEAGKKYGLKINAIVISKTPNNIKKLYKNITFKELMPKEELYKYYRIADVFIYPSPIDTFGFAIIEAMSFGVPTIAMKTPHTKSVEEIIVNGFNGLYFSEENYIEGMIESVNMMIVDRGIWQAMSDCCIHTMINGPYSIQYRNRKLREILSRCMTK